MLLLHIDYQVPPTGYTYINDGDDNEDSVTVVVGSGEDVTATVVSSYNPPQSLTYTLSGTWKDKDGNTLPQSEWPTSGSVTIPIRDGNYNVVGSFTLNPENNWTGTVSLISGGGNGSYKIVDQDKTVSGTSIDSIVFDETPLSDTTAGNFTYNGVVKPSTTTVHLSVSSNACDSNTGITLTNVPKNSKVILSYSGFYYAAWGNSYQAPGWELYGWDTSNQYNPHYESVSPNQSGNSPAQNIEITIGEADKYCVLIKGDPGFPTDSSGLNVSLTRLLTFGATNPSTSHNIIEYPDASGASSATNTLSITRTRVEASTPYTQQPVSLAVSNTRSAPVESTVSPSSLTIPTSISGAINTLNQNLATNADGYEYVLDPSFGKQVVLSDPWSYTFDDLEELGEGGHPYYYALIEVEVPEDYEVSYLNNPVNASDIKENMDAIAEANKHNMENPDEPMDVPSALTLSAINTSTTVVTGSVKVTKSFSGIDSLPNEFKITATYNDGTEDRTVELTTATAGMTGTGTSGDPYTWEIGSLPVGTVVTFTESGYDAEGHTVSINGSATASSQTATAAETPGTASFVNEYTRNPGGLELTKKVSGTGADQTKEFVFTIELTAPTGTTLAETYPVLKTGEDETSLTLDRTDGNTKASITVSLKHNQSWEIKDLPVGTGYTITETDYSGDGYTQSITKGIATGIVSGGTVTKEEVEFTNTYSAVDVTVIKIDESTRNAEHPENQTTLSGAKFKLYIQTAAPVKRQQEMMVHLLSKSCQMGSI